MNKAKVLSVAVGVLLWANASGSAEVFYVNVNGPNDPGSGSFDDPFRKIQDAISEAQGGDIVEIRPGTYTGAGNYNLDPNGKSITICSIDPNIAANTVIDPNGAGRGFYFHSGEDTNCIVAGLTIRNGCSGGGQSGGGIFCDNNSSPVIVNCIIIDNSTELYGGAVYCNNSNPQIKNCIVSNNRGRYGGGLGCFNAGNLTVTNCTIIKNSVIFSGGGIFCDMNGHAVINSSIIRANELDYPEQEYGPQVCLFDGSSASISYTNIEGGQEGVSVIESTLFWLSGNMDADPCFASFDPNGGDANLWDFHLQSAYGRWDTDFDRIDFNKDRIVNLFDFAEVAGAWLQSGNLPEDLNRDGTVDFADLKILVEHFLSTGWVVDTATSCCIDAGDPNSDWSSEPWPNGKRINMGAFGGTSQASKNGNIADFNLDWSVDFADLGEFSERWLAGGFYIEDLNEDGTVNFRDFVIFAENWRR